MVDYKLTLFDKKANITPCTIQLEYFTLLRDLYLDKKRD